MKLNKKRQKITNAFKVAMEGIIYTFKCNPLNKIYYTLILIMVLGCILFEISNIEKLLLVFTIGLVILCGMINIAIEKTIDMTTDEKHELGKIAKDVSSGGVVISILNALVTICVIFYDKINPRFYLILLIILIILFVGVKTLNKDK